MLKKASNKALSLMLAVMLSLAAFVALPATALAEDPASLNTILGQQVLVAPSNDAATPASVNITVPNSTESLLKSNLVFTGFAAGLYEVSGFIHANDREEIALNVGTNTVYIQVFQTEANSAYYVVTITRESNDPPTFGVTVVSEGTNPSGTGDYPAGATVYISAGYPYPQGREFSHWTVSPEVEFADANSQNTSFTMPAEEVTVTAQFVDVDTDARVQSVAGVGITPTEGDGIEIPFTADITVPYGKEAIGFSDTIMYSAQAGWDLFLDPSFDAGYVGSLMRAGDGEDVWEGDVPLNVGEPLHLYIQGNPEDRNSSPLRYDITVTREAPVYTITDHSHPEGWVKGSGDNIVITCDGDIEHFVGIMVNGEFLDAEHHDIAAGSTIATFNRAYLESLNIDSHGVVFVYLHGSAESHLTILEAPVTPALTLPVTNDAHGIALLLALAAGIGGLCLLITRKTRFARMR